MKLSLFFCSKRICRPYLQLALIASVLTLTPFLTRSAIAQSTTTLTSEGISGDLDSKRRSPVLSVTPVVESNNVKLLVDAYVANPDYTHLPIQFDFYINRHFFTSQIRSKELPGPVGVDISSQVATVPFNYTVIARLLHANREYTTVINGAVFASNLTKTIDCTLTTGLNGDESTEYVANNISTTQVGNNAFSISFETDSVSGGHKAKLSTTVNVDGDQAKATLSISQDNGLPTSVESEGDVVVSNGSLESLSLTSSDGDVALECS